ncbi:hypothetical protein AEGHOMDF_0067 [Methylobacterium soli]|jgi:hypothetical protein|nr:hypothetical protein AEGHOMDF_0067 [Methylobacterium soli]
MLWLVFGILGGFTLAGIAGIYAKQALIDDAKAETEGYF